MKKLGVAGAILALALLSFLAPSARAASGDAVSLCINVVSTASGSAVESCVPVSAGAPLPVAPSGAGGGNVSASLNKGPISITPPVTASAYTANNAIGGLQTVSVFRTTAQPSGIINSISLASKGGLTATEVLYVFTKSPASTCTDKAAFVLSSADLPYLVGGTPITLSPATTAGTTQTTAAASLNVSVSNQDSSPTTNLYVCAVTTGTPTPASTSDLIFNYSVLQD